MNQEVHRVSFVCCASFFPVLARTSFILTDNVVLKDRAQYCERFVEFLSDLQSQLPTRRYVNSLLQDLHLLPVMRLSPMYNSEDNALLRDLYGLLSHYTQFPIDDQTGVQLGQIEVYDKHCALLAKLQRVSLKHFKDKLTVLALSNFGAIDKRDELETLLQPLTDEEISQLCTLLQIRTAYPESLKLPIDRKYLMEFLIGMYERKRNFQDLTQDMSLVPTEQALYESGIGRADEYDGSRPLALPKLNLQYLSVGDFLWRALTLHRCESFYAIRKDIEAVLRRLRPELRQSGETVFGGFSKMALQISKPTYVSSTTKKLGIHRHADRVLQNFRDRSPPCRPDSALTGQSRDRYRCAALGREGAKGVGHSTT